MSSNQLLFSSSSNGQNEQNEQNEQTKETNSMNPTNFEQVAEFHRMFNHPIESEPQLEVFESNPQLVKFRLSQVEEEYEELIVAYNNKDFVECIDAICDLMYFVYGSFLVFGVNFDKYEPMPKVQNFNSKKLNTEIFNADANIFQTLAATLRQSLDLIKLSEEDKDFSKLIRFYAKLETICRSMGNLLGVDIDLCFAEVHRSNMTKLCLNEDIAKKTVEHYLNKKELRDKLLNDAVDEPTKLKIMEEHKVYEDPSYKYDGLKYWIVYDKATTKILKSIYFENPRLASIINFEK